MAMAIASAGSGFGTITLGLLTQKVIDDDNNENGEGWKSAFYMLSIVSAVGILLPAYFLTAPPSKRPAAEKKAPPPFSEVVSAPGLGYFMFCLFVFGFGGWNPVVHNFEAATDNGFSAVDVSRMISISFGIGSVVGRPLSAKILEATGRREGFPGILFLMALMAVLEPVMAGASTGSLELIFINNLVYGFAFGAFISVLPPITAELVGMEKFPAAIGLVYASFGSSMMLGPPLCGYWAAYEATETSTFINSTSTNSSTNSSTGSYVTTTGRPNYDWSYYASGIVMFVSAAMAIGSIYSENQLAAPPPPPQTVVVVSDESLQSDPRPAAAQGVRQI